MNYDHSTPPRFPGDFNPLPNGLNQELQAGFVDVSQVDWIQQMHALESLQWGGGEDHFDGTHDSFCFVCGSGMELFGCQTCKNCYHADCMLPALDPSEVPTFWFCPRCVERDLHVPTNVTEVTENTDAASIYPSPESTDASYEQQLSFTPRHNLISDMISMGDSHTAHPPKNSVIKPMPPPNLAHPLTSVTKSRRRPDDVDTRSSRGKANIVKRSSSPPRKKSKYSLLSSEVEKALSVIQAELETSAQVGRTEQDLNNRIKALEQQLKMQDGKLMLTSRELETALTRLSISAKEPAGLKSENMKLKAEVESLRKLVEERDSELRDWRNKLRAMVGGDLA